MENEKINNEINLKMFGILAVPTLIYALVSTVFLYSNFDSVTMILFVIATYFYDIKIAERINKEVKKHAKYFGLGMLLLAISDAFTASPLMIFYNNAMIFILMIGLLIYLYFDLSQLAGMRFVGVFFRVVFEGITCIGDFIYDIVETVKSNKNEKIKPYIYCILGIVIFIPIGILIVSLLISADAVFAEFVKAGFEKLFSVEAIIYVPAFFVAIYMGAYSLHRYVEKQEIKYNDKTADKWPEMVANTILVMISIIYVFFSGIQILSLFLGKMSLPDGYTYAKYAREGFYQLLFVCFLNVIIVLIIKSRFVEHNLTKALLVIICVCTYIMLASSAMRLSLYIKEYNLTVARVEAVWALAVVGIGMLVVIVSVFNIRVNIVKSFLIIGVIGVFVLTASRPEAIVAKFNIGHTSAIVDYNYMTDLSADAAPYCNVIKDIPMRNSYFYGLEEEYKQRSFRQFNFSWYKASKYFN